MCAIDSTITRFNAPIPAQATPNVYQRTRYATARLTVWMAVMKIPVYVILFRMVSRAALIHLIRTYIIMYLGQKIFKIFKAKR